MSFDKILTQLSKLYSIKQFTKGQIQEIKKKSKTTIFKLQLQILQNNLTFQFNTEVYSSFVSYLYQSDYYTYLIKVGLGLGEHACIAFELFYLCLLRCQRLRQTLSWNLFKSLDTMFGP